MTFYVVDYDVVYVSQENPSAIIGRFETEADAIDFAETCNGYDDEDPVNSTIQVVDGSAENPEWLAALIELYQNA